jgi:hypothetical protein
VLDDALPALAGYVRNAGFDVAAKVGELAYNDGHANSLEVIVNH